MTADEDVAENLVFLKQLVHKLNSALARHQPDPDGSVLEPQSVDVPAPWLVDPRHLSPLLNEYEKALGHFENELRKIQDENLERKHKLKAANDDNREMRREIDELKVLIREGESSDQPLIQGGGMAPNLQRQLELALSQKDEATKMCRDTMYQLDKLRHNQQIESASVKSRLQSYEETKRQNEQLNHANLNLQMTLESARNEILTLTAALHQQDQDLDETRNVAKESKSDFQKSKLSVMESRQKIKSLEMELEILRNNEEDYRRKEMISKTTTEKLRFALTDAESRLAQAQQACTESQNATNNLQTRISRLERETDEAETRERQLMEEMLELKRREESLTGERERACERAKEREAECERVRGVMEALVEECGVRVKEEEERTRRRCEQQVEQIRLDMKTTELELSNTRSECERAKRAKRFVEEEFESFRKTRLESDSNDRREQLQTRTLVAERAKSDALLNVQNLEEKISRLKMERESEVSSLIAKNEALERNLKRVKLESDESQHQRLLLTETTSRYKDQIQKLESSSNETKLECEKRLAHVRAKADVQTRRLEARLRSLEDSNRNEIQNLHKLLADQQRLSAKWKEELESASSEYESKISELQKQLARVRKRYSDVNNKLKQGIRETQRAPDLSETNRRLRARLHETEYRLMSATEKLGEIQGVKTALTLTDLRDHS